jgi:hypothetical protein
MADRDSKLDRLLKAERLAFERYDRLRGYPGDVQEVALALWTEATSVGRFSPRLTGAGPGRRHSLNQLMCRARNTPRPSSVKATECTGERPLASQPDRTPISIAAVARSD